MKTVAVLMSTYNGEKYITEQIESILRQQKVQVQLVVRDDGSSDQTLFILRDYEAKGKLTLLTGENLGVGNSFMTLLYEAPEADYYAFADQDDIWLEEKLDVAIRAIDEKGGPVLYCSNQMLVDQNATQLGLRYEKQPFITLFQVIDRNVLCGCTMVMNHSMAALMRAEGRRPSSELLKKRLHDSWLMQAGNCIGSVIYDEDSYILYRQHGQNVVGVEKMSVWKRLSLYVQVIIGKNMGHLRSRTAQELRDCFADVATKEAKEVLDLYANLHTIKGKIRFCSSDYAKQVTGNRLIFQIKVWTGQI